MQGPTRALIGEAGAELVMPLADAIPTIGAALAESQRVTDSRNLGGSGRASGIGGMQEMNASLVGGRGKGGGGGTIVAPTNNTNQSINNTTVMNTIFQDHPSFLLARKHQQRSEMF